MDAERFRCEYDPRSRDWLVLDHERGKTIAACFNDDYAPAVEFAALHAGQLNHREQLSRIERAIAALPGTARQNPELALPPAPEPLPTLLRIEDVERLSQFSHATIYKEINSGRLKTRRFGRSVRIHRDDFNAWAAEKPKRGRKTNPSP